MTVLQYYEALSIHISGDISWVHGHLENGHQPFSRSSQGGPRDTSTWHYKYITSIITAIYSGSKVTVLQNFAALSIHFEGDISWGHGLSENDHQQFGLGLLSIGVLSLSIQIISRLWGVCNAKLAHLWDPLHCCGQMADGRFLKAHGLNLYHLLYQCLELLSIGVPLLLLQCLSLFWYLCNAKLAYLGDP